MTSSCQISLTWDGKKLLERQTNFTNSLDFLTRELSFLKPTATLINILRGGVVNHTDLTNALQNGVTRAAALDVTESEETSSKRQLSNVTLTPHFCSSTASTRMNTMEAVVMNLKAGQIGEKLPFALN